MEVAVEVAREQSPAVLGRTQRKAIVDVLVVKHLVELAFEALLYGNHRNRLVGHGHVPNLHSEEITGHQVSLVQSERARVVAADDVREEVFGGEGLVAEGDGAGVADS